MNKVVKISKQRLNPEAWQAAHLNKSVVLSDKMYSMALELEGRSSRIIEREDLDILYGTTINAFLKRGYLVQHSATAVRWTSAGSKAVAAHGNANIHRNPSGRFSTYLSLADYDAIPTKERKAAS